MSSKLTNEEFQKRVLTKNKNVEFLGEYVNALTPVLLKCKICGYDKWEFIPKSDLYRNTCGCPACRCRQINIGVNDLATTRPDLIQYLKNKEDGNLYSQKSGKSIICKCPICGKEKIMRIATLSINGFSCDACGDGFSYPEKVIKNMLDQINVKYKYQKIFRWAINKRYDFYIPSKSIIIEVQGEQHYTQSFKNLGARTLQEEKANDEEKKLLALKHNIKNYIQLDCRESDVEYIKQSILQSNIYSLLNLKNIDWDACNDFYNKSMQAQVLDLWNNGMGVTEISNKLHISDTTIKKYLSNLSKLKLCYYNPQTNWDKTKFKKDALPCNTYYILCVENNRIFNGLKECAEYLITYTGLPINSRKILSACKNKEEAYGLHFSFIKFEQI